MEVGAISAGTREAFELPLGSTRPVPEDVHETLEYAILASQDDPSDPMDRAIQTAASAAAPVFQRDHMHRSWRLAREYPLSPKLLAVTRVWIRPGETGFHAAAKGAPEAIADLCRADANARRALTTRVESLARRGLRVIGVARARYDGRELPSEPVAFPFQLMDIRGRRAPESDSPSRDVAPLLRTGIDDFEPGIENPPAGDRSQRRCPSNEDQAMKAAQPDYIQMLEALRPDDTLSVQERAVGRPGVLEPVTFLVAEDPGVGSRDPLERKPDLIRVPEAQPDFRPVG